MFDGLDQQTLLTCPSVQLRINPIIRTGSFPSGAAQLSDSPNNDLLLPIEPWSGQLHNCFLAHCIAKKFSILPAFAKHDNAVTKSQQLNQLRGDHEWTSLPKPIGGSGYRSSDFAPTSIPLVGSSNSRRRDCGQPFTQHNLLLISSAQQKCQFIEMPIANIQSFRVGLS